MSRCAPERDSAVSSADDALGLTAADVSFMAPQLPVDIGAEIDVVFSAVNTAKHCFDNSTVPVSQQRKMMCAMRAIACKYAHSQIIVDSNFCSIMTCMHTLHKSVSSVGRVPLSLL